MLHGSMVGKSILLFWTINLGAAALELGWSYDCLVSSQLLISSWSEFVLQSFLPPAVSVLLYISLLLPHGSLGPLYYYAWCWCLILFRFFVFCMHGVMVSWLTLWYLFKTNVMFMAVRVTDICSFIFLYFLFPFLALWGCWSVLSLGVVGVFGSLGGIGCFCIYPSLLLHFAVLFDHESECWQHCESAPYNFTPISFFYVQSAYQWLI
jgi:hypothetical protein